MNTKIVDPVCGMELEPINAIAQSTYQGETYYFCSQECRQKFEKEPQKYIDKMEEPEHHH